MNYFGQDIQYWKDHHAYKSATEICQQPELWRKTLKLLKDHHQEIKDFIVPFLEEPESRILLCGAGSSALVAEVLEGYINKIVDFKARAVATTDIVQSPENYLQKGRPILMVSFSRSGDAPESIESIKLADTLCDEICHLIITCNKNGEFARFGKKQKHCLVISLPEKANDKAYSMTSSFSCMLLASLYCLDCEHFLSEEVALNQVIYHGERFLEHGYKEFKDLVNQFDFYRIIYVGANALKGISHEGARKAIELTGGILEAYYASPMGFRHGTNALLNSGTLTVLFVSDDPHQRKYDEDLAAEICKIKGRGKLAIVCGHHNLTLQDDADVFYPFDLAAPMDNIFLALDFLLVAQTISLFKSIQLDVSPDQPHSNKNIADARKNVKIHPYVVEGYLDETIKEININEKDHIAKPESNVDENEAAKEEVQ